MNDKMTRVSPMVKVPGTVFRAINIRRLKNAGCLSILSATFMISINLNSAHAAIVNGEFMGLDPVNKIIPGWSPLGSPPLFRTPAFNFAPFGDEVVLMDTPEDFSPGTTPPLVSDIEMHLSLTAGSISALGNSPVNGAVIAQTFTANAGDVLSFEFNHLSFDDTHVFDPMTTINDFSFVSLFGPGSSILQIIGDRFTLTGDPDNLGGIPAESGLATFMSPPLLGGTYTLGIGVLNSGFSFGSSALLVDNVTLTAVPEVRAWVALGMLTVVLLSLTVARARTKKRPSNLTAA
jgi:hypothetical protein